jgi:hypothetical protein
MGTIKEEAIRASRTYVDALYSVNELKQQLETAKTSLKEAEEQAIKKIRDAEITYVILKPKSNEGSIILQQLYIINYPR